MQTQFLTPINKVEYIYCPDIEKLVQYFNFTLIVLSDNPNRVQHQRLKSPLAAQLASVQGSEQFHVETKPRRPKSNSPEESIRRTEKSPYRKIVGSFGFHAERFPRLIIAPRVWSRQRETEGMEGEAMIKRKRASRSADASASARRRPGRRIWGKRMRNNREKNVSVVCGAA